VGRPGSVPSGTAAPAPMHADWIDRSTPVTLVPRTDATCVHVGSIREVLPSAQGCEECLCDGTPWVHLRICLACGHVGCCESSAGKHAMAHHHETGHPIARSIEPGEAWGWCYVDEVVLKPRRDA